MVMKTETVRQLLNECVKKIVINKDLSEFIGDEQVENVDTLILQFKDGIQIGIPVRN